MIHVKRVKSDDNLYKDLILYADNCSWKGVGAHLARLLRENLLVDWESAFVLMDDQKIIGFCTFQKTDYYPENRYWPWTSCIFVEEEYRGNKHSFKLIDFVCDYAKLNGFDRVYIPSDITGFYEQNGFVKIDELMNYSNEMDSVFCKEI